MNKQDLKQLSTLYSEFEKECQRVADILSNLENHNGEVMYATEFKPGGNIVIWSGHDTFWHETTYYYGDFPLEYLTMTDDELKEIVEKENEAHRKKEDEDEKKKEEAEKAKRREEYEKLKKEFEG